MSQNPFAPLAWRSIRRIGMVIGVSTVALLAAASPQVYETTADGLTEPYRTVDVAATEPGSITQVFVREGDVVRKGQPIASLDSDVHAALLAIARQAMDSQGNLLSAQADLQLKKDRLAKFEMLRAANHAREEEVERARAEVAIADAKLLSVREELELRRLEHEKIKVQMERRTIRSPIDGVVAKTAKDEGEYVAANDPTIATLVQLDRLIGVFSVLSPSARDLRVDQKVRVNFPGATLPTEGTIEFIAPLTDAESGTVRVKVRIENAKHEYRSGERCILELPTAKRTKEPLAKSGPVPKR